MHTLAYVIDFRHEPGIISLSMSYFSRDKIFTCLFIIAVNIVKLDMMTFMSSFPFSLQ